MFPEIEQTAGSLALEEREEEPVVSLTHLIKDLLFQVCLLHQGPVKKSKVKGSLKTWLQLLFILVQMFQVLSIEVGFTTTVSNYSTYRYFAQALEVVRPDLWIIDTGQVTAGVLVTLAMLPIVLCEVIAEVLVIYFLPKRKVPISVRLIVDLPLSTVHRFVSIPLMLLYFTTINNSLFGNSTAQWIGLLCVPGLIGFWGLIIVRICFLYEIAWSRRKLELLSHPNSSYELKEFAVHCAICLISVINGSGMLSLFLICLLTTYLLCLLLWFVPYYHPVTQIFKTVQFGICAWGCVSGFVGIGIDSMTATAELFIFVTPCFILLILRLLSWRLSLVRVQKGNQPFWKFELVIRQKFAQMEEDETMETDLKEILEFGGKLYTGKQREYFLLLAHYYYYIRDEPEIALLRLSSSMICPNDFIIQFHIFRFSEGLCKLSKSEEREFVDYQTLYQSTRALDCKLCEMSFDLFNVLITKNTNAEQLELSFRNLAKVIKLSRRSYRSLKSKFPTDPFVLESYGSFIGDLFFDPRAQDLITRGYFERNRRKRTHINTIESYSSEDTGVLIISCHPELLGKIIFANDQLGVILGCKVQEIIGKDLDDFIPPPFNYKHNKKLINFLAQGEAKQVFRSHLFLSSNQKFSVEVTFRFRPTVVKGVSYFVTAVRPKPKTREFALFDSNFVITSHSFSLPQALELETQKDLTGVDLEQLLPGVTKSFTGEAAPFVYVHPKTMAHWGMKYTEVGFGKVIIRWLYVFTSERGIEDLFTNTTGEALNQFKRSFRSSMASSDEKRGDVSERNENRAHFTGIDETLPKESRTQTTIAKDAKEDLTQTSLLASYAYSSTGMYQLRKANRAVKTLMISYLVIIILIAILLAIGLAVLYTALRSSSQSSDTVDLGLSRLHLVKVMHLARRLNLLENGLENVSLKVDLQSQLQIEITSLSSVMNKFFKQEEKEVSVWNIRDKQYIFSPTRLIAALTDYNTHAQFQVDAPSPDCFSSDFFYTYYNGIATLIDSLNSTADKYVNQMETEGMTMIEVTSGVALLLMALVLGVSNLCIAKSLYQVEMCYRKLWEVIISLSQLRLRELMNTHKDRIEIVHGTEHVITEHNRLHENKGILHPPKKWTLIIAKTSIFAIGSSAFLLFILIYGYSEIQVLLYSNETYLTNVSYNLFLPTLNLHLLKELYLMKMNASISYFSIVKEGQQVFSLDAEIQEMTDSMSYFENTILANTAQINENANSAQFSDMTLSYFDACPYLNSTDTACPFTALAKGQHPTILELQFLIWDYKQRIHTNSLTWSQVLALEDYVDMVTEATFLLLAQTQNYVSQSSQTFANDMMAYSAVYIIASILLFLVLYLPNIYSLQQQCMSLWRITTLVRNDQVTTKES